MLKQGIINLELPQKSGILKGRFRDVGLTSLLACDLIYNLQSIRRLHTRPQVGGYQVNLFTNKKLPHF